MVDENLKTELNSVATHFRVFAMGLPDINQIIQRNASEEEQKQLLPLYGDSAMTIKEAEGLDWEQILDTVSIPKNWREENISLTNLFAQVISRSEDEQTLTSCISAWVVADKKRLSDGFDSLKAPALAKLVRLKK